MSTQCAQNMEIQFIFRNIGQNKRLWSIYFQHRRYRFCQLFPFAFRFITHKGAVQVYFPSFVSEIAAVGVDRERYKQWIYASAERLNRPAKFLMMFPNISFSCS